MRSWVQAGHLSHDREVSSSPDGRAVPIRELFPDLEHAFAPNTLPHDLKQARKCVQLLLHTLASGAR